MSTHLTTLLHLAHDPAFIPAALTWRRFSATSFLMIRSLRRQGICPQAVIDIGANTGQFAYAAFATWKPRLLLSFEPTPAPFARLARVLHGLPGAECHQLALGDASGSLTMHLNTHSHSSSALPLADAHRDAFPQAQESGTITVPVRTLDAVLEGRDLPPDTLLKIDVQGFEQKVLAGAVASLPRLRWIILEASLKPLYQGEAVFLELQDQLKALGFAFKRPVGFLQHGTTDEVLQMDCLFERQA